MTTEVIVSADRGPSGGPVPAGRARGLRGTAGALRRFVRAQPLGAAGLLLITVFVLAALLAPWIAPHDPLEQYRRNILEGPSARFLFGTDDLGRDVLSRCIHGARTSLLIGVATTALSLVLGTAVGVVSGYFGRGVDLVLQRVMDTVQAVPGIVLLLFIAVILGPSVRNTVIALTVVITPSFNRIARGETLRIREERYIEAARATGATTPRILALHVLPNMFAPVFTLASLIFGGVIIAESALSFLGIGAPPPTPSWGAMLSEGVRYVERAPWIIIVPAILLSLAVFSFNLLGDALRDHLDPRLQKRSAVANEARRWWGRRRPPTRLAPSLARAADRADDRADDPPTPPAP